MIDVSIQYMAKNHFFAEFLGKDISASIHDRNLRAIFIYHGTLPSMNKGGKRVRVP